MVSLLLSSFEGPDKVDSAEKLLGDYNILEHRGSLYGHWNTSDELEEDSIGEESNILLYVYV